MTAAQADRSGIKAIADTVLFEGYMLYPYRANDRKNRVRWQFGVLAPPGFVALDPSERAFCRADCLLEGHDVTVSVQARFLHVQRRTVERTDAGGFTPTDSLDVGDATFLPWDEAVVHESTSTFTLPGLGSVADSSVVRAQAAADTQLLHAADGQVIGRLIRERESLDALLSVDAEPLPGPYGVRRLRLRLENRTDWAAPHSGDPARPDRPDALRHALVAAHLLVSVDGGAFVSLIDPPEWAKEYATGCAQVGVFPVLAGLPGDRSQILAAPITLYDHPQVAPESDSQFCDSLEMDELLTLWTLTLTDEEKRQARGSDPRGAALVDQIENLPPQLMDRLHGAIRSMTAVARPTAAPLPDEAHPALSFWDPVAQQNVDPDADCVLVAGVAVRRGTHVRLHPNTRRTDAQDMFLDGRTATVEAVLSDLDGGRHVAVTLDELAELDPDGVNPHGRFLYFAPDELEPVGAGA